MNFEEALKAEAAGIVIILNGAPRSGKSSIAREIQDTFDGIWMNLGVDNYMQAIPERYQPGIGLRPGGERPDLEPLIDTLYQALYASIAAHSKLGINIVADFGHHDMYSQSRSILARCARIIADCPVMFVGVRCPIGVIMERRAATWGRGYQDDGEIPLPVQRWQEAVHKHEYDIEVDTSVLSAKQCAELIGDKLKDIHTFTAFKEADK